MRLFINFNAKKFFSLISLIIISLALILPFQNCSNSKFDATQSNKLASNAKNQVQCDSTHPKSCSLAVGTGSQYCDDQGNPLTCSLESCVSGYKLEGSTCVAESCTANTQKSCTNAANSGVGIQICNPAGTGFSDCQLNSCNFGFKLVNGDCVPTSCEANSKVACTNNDRTGTGTQTCNGQGTSFGSCILESCNSGYNLQNGSCTQNQCSPNSQQNCVDPLNTGSGIQICNSTGTGFGTCQLNACKPDYNLQNGVCVHNSCTPIKTSTCSNSNGTGSGIQTCNAQGTGYDACVITTCIANYNLQNGSCIQNVCTPNSQQNCSNSTNTGSGIQVCSSTGSGFGSCQLQTCITGYNLQNGVCVQNACNPNSVTACTVGAGTGTQTCNAQGTGNSLCAITSCSSGYIFQNGGCTYDSRKWSYKVTYDRYKSVNCQGSPYVTDLDYGYYGKWNDNGQSSYQDCETQRQQMLNSSCDIPDEYGGSACQSDGTCYSGNVKPTSGCEVMN